MRPVINPFVQELLKLPAAQHVHILPINNCLPERERIPLYSHLRQQYCQLNLTTGPLGRLFKGLSSADVESAARQIDCGFVDGLRMHELVEDRYRGRFDFLPAFHAHLQDMGRLGSMEDYWKFYARLNDSAIHASAADWGADYDAVREGVERRCKMTYIAFVREMHAMALFAELEGWRVFYHPLVDYACRCDLIVVPPNWSEAGVAGVRVLLNSARSHAYIGQHKEVPIALFKHLHHVIGLPVDVDLQQRARDEVILVSRASLEAVAATLQRGVDAWEDAVLYQSNQCLFACAD